LELPVRERRKVFFTALGEVTSLLNCDRFVASKNLLLLVVGELNLQDMQLSYVDNGWMSHGGPKELNVVCPLGCHGVFYD